MAFPNLKEINDLIKSEFDKLPKPDLPYEYDSYGILEDDGLISRIWMHSGAYCDTWITWIVARALSETPRKRKAVAIAWSSEELLTNPIDTIRAKLLKATENFNELAIHFEAGGALPFPQGELVAR